MEIHCFLPLSLAGFVTLLVGVAVSNIAEIKNGIDRGKSPLKI